MQFSVAAGCKGATGKGAKNPLVVGLLNDRLFSPVTVRVEVEVERKRKDLKKVKIDGLRGRAKQRKKGKRQKQHLSLHLNRYDSWCCDLF